MKGTEELFALYVAICVLNAFLSYIAVTLNVITINAIRKTSSLPQTLKTMLLSLSVSDLGVGLLVQPLFIALRIMELKQKTDKNPTFNATYIAFLLPLNFFTFASLFIVLFVIYCWKMRNIRKTVINILRRVYASTFRAKQD